MTINPYLNFPGTTETVFNFYKSVFGGEFAALQRFKDMPDNSKCSPQMLEQIMHISLPLAPGYYLMASDAPAEMGFTVQQGNNYYINISPDSLEEANRIFNALSEGGQVEMPLEEMFWGAYFSTFTDKFGIRWMINYAKPQ